MNKLSRIVNPYSLLILGVFVEYFPAYYGETKPSISLGAIDLYITDISLIVLLISAFFSILSGQSRPLVKIKNNGREVQIVFGLFIALCLVKWLLQNPINITSIRVLLSYMAAYIFLFFFPILIRRNTQLKNLITLLIVFQVYIFILHIYGFATQGYKLHILSGNFLSMLSLLFFLSIGRTNLLRLSNAQSTILKGLVVTTYFMVGHRSGFIALLLGLLVLSFFSKKSAFKEMAVISVILVIGAVMASVLSPNIFSKIAERASTTFDASETTYVGRFEQYFTTLQFIKEHPVIGKPMTLSESIVEKYYEVRRGNRTAKVYGLVVTPHNLVFEWWLYLGTIGLLLGGALIVLGARFIRRFITEHKSDTLSYQLGIVVLCSMVHNLFYAITNTTLLSVFSTFFLYFPLVILVSVSRNGPAFFK